MISPRSFFASCALLLILVALPGCWVGGSTGNADVSALGTGTESDYWTSFAVIADPHYMDPDLLVEPSSAFEAYLAQDRKMLKESQAILEKVMEMILAKNEAAENKYKFLIVSGDLTKDGARTSHEKFASYMAQIEAAGIEVYVVPGNHDINNPHALAYNGDTTTVVDNVSPDDFASIYAQYGYSQALERDPNSLSYLAEPVEGLWLLALDSCKYADNPEPGEGSPETSGAFSEETLAWITEKLAEAETEGKKVIATMHHGLVEHYTGQAQLFGEYIIDDYLEVSQALALAGLGVVYTGHYHAQDVTLKNTWDSQEQSYQVFDVETGSLVTYPCPIRYVSVDKYGVETITSDTVTEIDYDLGGLEFPDYAMNTLTEGLDIIATATLTAPVAQGGFGLTEEQAAQVSPLIVAAFVAHYSGDESMDAETYQTIVTLLSSEDATMQTLGQYLGTLWTDLAPPDNNVVIDPATGYYN